MADRQTLANAIRALSMDAVQQANSGHPGMPMGMADIAEVLWNNFLQHNPNNPDWYNRDRFVLSNGHGSMLLYSVLHLSGYDLTIYDLKNFRQLHSKTPGHPEYSDTPGVETTTGPLGQGIANAVGMALAEAKLAAEFNRDSFEIVDHYTYAFLGDGCLMEGVSHEACALAGTLGLGKLIAVWDDNGISIDGEVGNWFSDNTPERFRAYGWQVIDNVDGHDSEAIQQAFAAAKANQTQPTLICCKTSIGFGSPKLAGTAKAHGAPLGDEEIAATRKQLGWDHPAFEIPADIYQAFDAKAAGAQREADWQASFDVYQQAHPTLAAEFLRRMRGELPTDFEKQCDAYIAHCNDEAKAIATRKSSLNSLNHYQPLLPELLGGSADLSGSNCTNFADNSVITADNLGGNYIQYGVREFGMSAIMNGLALHGGIIPYGGTFLVFSDYARNAIRLSSLMKQKVIYVYSHDSIGLGEDGPTHQPIEHTASLRLIPNLHVWRPCDATETAVAWQQALLYQGPSCLLLSRQNLDEQPHTNTADIARGGYILQDCDTPACVIIATGSEVALAVAAAKKLQNVRVVSMPCLESFAAQDQAYQDRVLPPQLTKRVVIEAGVTAAWHQYSGSEGLVIGIDQFGVSAPIDDAYAEFGLTTDKITESISTLLKK